ncbi:hypothetical protein H4R26_005046 [Coemansia thaxteri]|uniref:Phosphatidic acid phosphatase type 2/haloperoxidase domain-containing protein n=1 Tax=Coemansia thaxteri TaxID=2663907 RepID=A0A9W8BEZ5_9FUNG|nr:hypothetical protein H4R26_005046 [Coemansia thaxteri]KAJ2477839.1 hypothetical protein EV174_004493 [Coemansia sp. RSA 2320]
MMITNTIKNLAGRHRPDFISRCNLDVANAQTLEPFIGLLTTSVCRQSDKSFFWDGMRSFPSGHTSFSFAGFTYLALWLGGHMHIGDRRGRTYKSFVVLVPLLTAMLIGVSRTKDYRHHWQDVLAGAILGIFMGWFGYHQYYPSPFDATVDPSVPHPPRIPETPPVHSFDMKSFSRVAGDGNGGTGIELGLNSAASAAVSTAPGLAAMEQPRHLAHNNASTGSVYSQQYGSQVQPRTPAQAHGASSRDSLVGSSYRTH